MGTRSPKEKWQAIFDGNLASHCKVMKLYGELCKNGWIDRDAVFDEDSNEPNEPRIRWEVQIPQGKRQFSGVIRTIQ